LASGVGKPFSVSQTRAAMVARLQTLLQGHSGASERVIMALKQMLDEGITPIVPQLGTVGASGDLTPLSHLALAMCGEGDVVFNRQQRSAQSALAERGIAPINLTRRDALALVNGCSFSAAVAGLNGARARRLLRWAMLCASGYSQVLGAHDEALSPLLAAVRPHFGQLTVREELFRLNLGNTYTKAKADVGVPPQDPYTLRCQTQIFGAILDALDHHDATVEIELNSVSDNPTLDPESGAVVHGGNFFGQHVAFVSDYLRIALIQWAQWCERAIARLVDPSLNQQSLPAQLRGKPGHSGFMGAQVTATALLAELKSSAIAASIQGVSTNANNQDIVPMATMAARHTSDALDLLANLQAILMLALCQSVDFLAADADKKFSPALLAMHARVRENIPWMAVDRSMTNDIQLIAALMNNREPGGAFSVLFF
jgi:tyrosine ammonia-lyase